MSLWVASILAALITAAAWYFARTQHKRRIEQHDRKLADRLEAGEDRYFEELRTLQAYDPRDTPPWKYPAFEGVMMVASFTSVVALLMKVFA